ncbi:hypothetical protein ACIP01_06510 [Pseudomonas monteilii]|uniref:hypothetical protein n=1 Tax=Pseudomonas monteilii TaxID=76759 RepID=UPI003800A1F2
MHETLKIKIDFLKERQRPAEIFQAMSSYIEAYQAIGQVMASSFDTNQEFALRLEDVQTGSIASLLRAVPGRITGWFESAIFDSSMKLAQNLEGVEATTTEEEVDQLASRVEASLAAHYSDQLFDPKIDRKAFAFALNKLSEANKKLLPEEGASATIVESENVTAINTHWRFNGNPKEMFEGTTEITRCVDKLYVRAPVNIGKGAWAMLSVSTNSRYTAKIVDASWLDDYQGGLIPAIGPKDVMEAEVALEIYTPPLGKGRPFVSSAKILKVMRIHRDVGLQHETKPLI